MLDSCNVWDGTDTVPWTAKQMYDAGLARIAVPAVCAAQWTEADWLRSTEYFFAYAVGYTLGLQEFIAAGGKILPDGRGRWATWSAAQRQADMMQTRCALNWQVVVVRVVPCDRA